MIEEALKRLAETLPDPVARHRIKIHWPDGPSPGHMANCDSAGTGPKDRIRIGRRVYYSRDSFLQWLRSRSS